MPECQGTPCSNQAKLGKWLSCVVSIYLYGVFDCMFVGINKKSKFMAGFNWLQFLQEKCFPRKRSFMWSIMIFLRLLQYFCESQVKKKITETVLVCLFHQQDVNRFWLPLTTPFPLNVNLERMKPHVILIYSLICEWNYLINWNLSQCLLFIFYNMNKNILWQVYQIIKICNSFQT